MGFEDFDNFKIQRNTVMKDNISIKRNVWIPALYKKEKDSIELNGIKTGMPEYSSKMNDLISVTKGILQNTFKISTDNNESEVPEKIRKYEERERSFYFECMKWEAASEEKILNLIEYISQMEPKDKEAVLDENFAYVSRAEELFETEERITSAFKDGRITKGDVIGIAQLPSNQAECIMDLLKNKKFTIFLEMNKNLGEFGLESIADIEEYLSENPGAFGKDVKYLTDEGFDVFTALTFAYNPEFGNKVQGFINSGCSEKTALMLANIENLENFDKAEVARLCENISGKTKYDMETAQYLSDFLNAEENAGLNLSDFNSYIENINIDELEEIAPAVRRFGGREMLNFANFHYKSGTKEYTKETLTMPGDFTSFLKQNYINADKLTELLSVYPLTSRNVGMMPEGWLEKRNDKDRATEEIYSAITNFQETGNDGKFEEELSKITGKETKVKQLGSGHYGTGYKISMQGSDDMCLKLFESGKIKRETNNIHGQHIEVQTGLFVNEHSNNFVKMYFGRVSPGDNDDGFIVTQFLSEETEPVETGTDNGEDYLIASGDTSGKCNIIQGKIIDYGSVMVDIKRAEGF